MRKSSPFFTTTPFPHLIPPTFLSNTEKKIMRKKFYFLSTYISVFGFGWCGFKSMEFIWYCMLFLIVQSINISMPYFSLEMWGYYEDGRRVFYYYVLFLHSVRGYWNADYIKHINSEKLFLDFMMSNVFKSWRVIRRSFHSINFKNLLVYFTYQIFKRQTIEKSFFFFSNYGIHIGTFCKHSKKNERKRTTKTSIVDRIVFVVVDDFPYPGWHSICRWMCINHNKYPETLIWQEILYFFLGYISVFEYIYDIKINKVNPNVIETFSPFCIIHWWTVVVPSLTNIWVNE